MADTTRPKKAFILRMAHGRDRVPEAIKKGELVLGWSEARGLLSTNEWQEFREIIHARYHAGEDDYRKAGRAAGNAWRFLKEMEVGSWVVVPVAGAFHVAEVTSEPSHDPSRVRDDSAYVRRAHWLNPNEPIQRSLARADLQSRMKIYGTTADASDLIDDIADALATLGVSKGDRPRFDRDLRRRLVDQALAEIQSGRIDSFGFERLVEAILRATGGHSVRIIARSKDKGADVTADFRVAGAISVRVAVQAKHFRKEPPVGVAVVDKLIEGMDAEGAHYGIIMTSGSFAPDVEAYVKELEEKDNRRIELVDGQQLAALVVDYGLAKVDVLDV